MSNEHRALKSGVWYTVSNFLTRGVSFLTTPLFTRLLTQAEYGDYSNYITWMGIFSILITLNLHSTLISAKYDYKDRFDNYILSVLTMGSLSILIWAFFLNLFSAQVQTMLNMSSMLMNCMLFNMFFQVAVDMYLARERFLYKYEASVITSMAISIGGSLLSVLLVLTLPNKVMGRILGNSIPAILIGFAAYLFFFLKGGRLSFSCWSYAIRTCLPYIPHLLSLNLLNSMDRVMIREFYGSEETALYSLAYTCGTMITLLITSLNSAFAPWLGDKLHNKEYTAIRQFSLKYISIFCYFAVAVMLLAPEILFILGGSSYYAAVYVIPPVTMGCICQFIYSMFVNVEQFSKKTFGMALGSASAALLNYILNYLLIPRFGYIAAAYTTLVGFLWLLAVHMWLVYHIGLHVVYPYGKIGIIVLILLCMTVGINILYYMPMIRYISICGYAGGGFLIIWKFRNEILDLISKFRNK